MTTQTLRGTVVRHVGPISIIKTAERRMTFSWLGEPIPIGSDVAFETDDYSEIVRRLRIVGKRWQEAVREAEGTIAERVGDVNSGPRR